MRGGFAALLAACLIAVAPAVPASAAPAGEACDVSYQPTPGGNGIFDVRIIITNTSGYDITGWTLAFVLPPGQSYEGNPWEVIIVSDGSAVTGSNQPWNGPVKKDGKVQVGFKVRGPDYRVEPTRFTVNTEPCSVSP
ncbi:cellulose binding domain-containing protein [Catenuloplanes atrovinosus]|uniref:CBM2 domain-containing protein n=1 Tax=Catenuloplanes atrovinosus TaxID=137266 RepID=A0AAE3YKZ2_9ACTN|nr:cellulose binding domain-containing protein [Catenuloplanes atrovinosus]MDR7274837.1 hypothetical protein [Catenuloplanes atrovinosus]